MDSSLWFDIITWDNPLYISRDALLYFSKNSLFLSEDTFLVLCSILSGSSLFAKVSLYGFAVYTRVVMDDTLDPKFFKPEKNLEFFWLKILGPEMSILVGLRE